MPTESVVCEHCGLSTPEAPYCVRCGNPLHPASDDPAVVTGGRRRPTDFAAAPGEPALALRIASTLFPHLPRADIEPFRWALLISAAAIVAPAMLGFYPVALIVAALAVPLVMILYLHTVDVYEDEPVRVLGFTAAWGAIAGLAVGAVGRLIADPNPVGGGPDLLARGVILPIVGLALAAVGPLLLLRFRKFNDVLDGTTFGAVAGVWFVGAQALASGVELIAGGLRPPGELTSWLVRLLSQGVVAPLLWAATLGSITGAFWLRYRAPVQDRGRLGVVGRPAVTAVAGAILLVAADASQLLLGQPVGELVLVALTVLPLVWLRRAIHLGLLEEAAEGEIGPPIRCGNCGRMTPHHTFCAHCGIALRALPKTARRLSRPQRDQGS